MPVTFLKNPGRSGAFGALMDEYARAAEDFCRVVESVPPPRFGEERASEDPDAVSIRAICAHAIRSAFRYADYVNIARGAPATEPFEFAPERLASPADVRDHIRDALRHTEDVLEGLYDAPPAVAEAITFKVRWGPTYDPEMILEHGIVHLLRHRRQVERWAGSA